MIPSGLPHRFPRSALLLSVAFSLQCGLSEIVDQLTTSFTVVPADVPSGSQFEARLVITNPTIRTVSLQSAYSCPAFLETRRGGEEVVVEGTQIYCPAEFVSFAIPAQGELVRTYTLVARVRSPSDPPSAYAAAPPGSYTLRADLNMSLPDVEADFRVIAAASAR